MPNASVSSRKTRFIEFKYVNIGGESIGVIEYGLAHGNKMTQPKN